MPGPAEGGTQHRAGRQRGFCLPFTAQVQLQRGAYRHPGPELPQLHTAEGCRRGSAHQEHPGPGLFRREPPQTQAHSRRQQRVRRTVEHQLCPAIAAKGKAQRHAHQRAAARQRRHRQLFGPHPPHGHGGTQRTQQADAAQRKRPEAVQQHPQRRACRAGRKAVLGKAQYKAQAKGHQRPVQHGPAARKAHGHRRQSARRRPQLGPQCPRRKPCPASVHR